MYYTTLQSQVFQYLEDRYSYEQIPVILNNNNKSYHLLIIKEKIKENKYEKNV